MAIKIPSKNILEKSKSLINDNVVSRVNVEVQTVMVDPKPDEYTAVDLRITPPQNLIDEAEARFSRIMNSSDEIFKFTEDYDFEAATIKLPITGEQIIYAFVYSHPVVAKDVVIELPFTQDLVELDTKNFVIRPKHKIYKGSGKCQFTSNNSGFTLNGLVDYDNKSISENSTL